MRDWCKNEFSLKYCSLHHEDPFVFVKSQWQRESKPSIIYLGYRWLIATFFLAILVVSVGDVCHKDSPFYTRVKWLIYLTNWGLAICTFQTFVAAVILSICMAASCRNKPSLQDTTLKCYKMYWVVNTMATDAAFSISILYWSVVYNGRSLETLDYLTHGQNSVLMLIDLFVLAHPTRLLHFCYSFTLIMCYLLFSLVYPLAGGTNVNGKPYIYPVTDWGKKPGLTTGFAVAVLCLVVAVHVGTWVLYRFRVWIHSKIIKIRTDYGAGDSREEQ